MKNMLKVLTVLAALTAILLLAAVPGMAEETVAVQVSVTIATDGPMPGTPDTTNALLLKAEGDFPMPAGSANGEYVLSNPGIGTVSFPAIVFDGVGDHYYTISQIPGTHVDALEYDSKSYSLRIMVYWDENHENKLFTAFLRPGSNGGEKDTTCTFINRYSDRVTLTIRKAWVDTAATAARPASLIMTLSGEGFGGTVTLNAANNWTASITDLPRFRNGREITYTWSEPAIAGYTQTSVTTDIRTSEITTIITNTRNNVPPRVPVIEEEETPLGLGIVYINVGDCLE